MARERADSPLRQMIDDRDQGRSETRESFDQAREDDPSIVHENAHLRKESEIDRETPGRQPANTERQPFEPELAQNGQLTERFEKSREDDARVSHEIPLQKDDREERDTGSQMVKESAPRYEPRPSDQLSKAVDREAFSRRWAEEMKRAGIEFEQRPEQDKGYELDREQDMERTRDRER